MSVATLVVLSLLASAREQPIDDFHYADPAAARRAWVASDGTPPVTVSQEGGRPVLEFTAPFAADPNLSRTVLDRELDLDLSVPGQFTLDLFASEPEAVGQVSLYFRSGSGWFAGGSGLAKAGWHTLTFSKAAFRTEGTPTGWQKIDGVRLSLWRGRAADATVRLGRLAAQWHDVALVIPSSSSGHGQGELHTALETAQTVSGLLDELGLGADAVDDVALTLGALGLRRIAVIAYHPGLNDAALAALEKFVAGGGKLVVCYTLPPRLAKLLGVATPRYVRQQAPGQFAEIRLEADDLPGLPTVVHQASWNITAVEPAGQGAKVVGRWFDADGRPTGLPALVVSDTGAFFSHVVLPDDRGGKKQLLAAILGRLEPSLWETMAQSELQRASRAGHCDDIDSVRRFVRDFRDPTALARLDEAVAGLESARRDMAGRQYPQAVRQARQAHEHLAEAYLRSQASPAVEGRAIWNHSGTGAYPGDWERTAKELANAGFNMIIPNILWAGVAHYPSDVLPRSETYRQYGDQIAQCVAAAHRHRLEVHVWKVNHNLSTAPKDFVEKLRREGRLQSSVAGQTHEWLCPSNPENFKLEVDSMLEVARRYDVDGLHFDYIRYPSDEFCYCDGCRRRFLADTGITVAHWPEDCHSGPQKQAYHDWRCRQITRLVAAVHDQAKQLKPKLKISAAVFGSYPDCREGVGQDWVAWVKAGYLDFVCPMDYTQTDPPFVGLVSTQLKLVGGRIPVYPGIGAWRLGSPDRVASQIHYARSLQAAGFTVFNLDASAAESLLPALRLGAGSHSAVPPHCVKPQ